ncbi:MAG: hypothetical protein ROO73_00975 [Roseivirga sp.]
MFNLRLPDTTRLLPPITGEMLTRAFNMALDLTVPGSEGIKILLGTVERPETLEQCVEAALNTALDFIPMGKVFKQGAALCSFSPKQVLKQKLRELLKKKAGKPVKAAGQVLQSGGNKLSKRTLKALGLTKEQGKDAIHALKDACTLPNAFHGQILANGNYIHPQTKQVIDNLFN